MANKNANSFGNINLNDPKQLEKMLMKKGIKYLSRYILEKRDKKHELEKTGPDKDLSPNEKMKLEVAQDVFFSKMRKRIKIMEILEEDD